MLLEYQTLKSPTGETNSGNHLGKNPIRKNQLGKTNSEKPTLKKQLGNNGGVTHPRDGYGDGAS